MSNGKKIETGFATIRTDYIASEANGYSSIAIHLEHGLKLPELATKARDIALKLRELVKELELLPQAQEVD